MRRIVGSFTRSGANLFEDAWPWVSNSQPTCACQSPLAIPRSPAPAPAWGLWGSPSSSVKVWCLRWSATQSITPPCSDSDPSTASV